MQRAAGGSHKQLAALCLFQPLSHGLRRASSPFGEPFGCGISSAYSAVPLRGAIVSMGLRGVQGGLRGEIEIFPGPPAKRSYKEACSAFCLFYSLSLACGSTAPSTGSLLAAVQTLTLSLHLRGRWILRSKSRRELKKDNRFDLNPKS